MSENNRTQILTRLRAQCTPWTDAQDLDPNGAVLGPAFANHAARLEAFAAAVAQSGAQLDRAATAAEVRDALLGTAAASGAAEVVVPEPQVAAFLNTCVGPGAVLAQRAVRPDDALAVVWAEAGIAETGTLVVSDRIECPAQSNFLPAHWVVILHALDLVDHFEAYWDSRARTGQTGPRSLHWITGPSRTADIGMQMQVGAHGPIGVHVLLLTGELGIHDLEA